MNKLEQLIQELCPHGVEYKKLGEIGKFFSGLSGKTKIDFLNGNSRYVSYMNVYKNLAVDLNYNDYVQIKEYEVQNKLQYGDIIFTGSSENLEECGLSSVVTQQLVESLYLNSFCFGFRFNSLILLPEFSKYLFRANQIRKQIVKTAKGVTRFNVSKIKMENVLIPIPPLEVQKEIVRILDTFTELEKELEKELEARKKQYEFYREQLLSFDDSVNWIQLGDCIEKNIGGGTPSKTITSYWNGTIPWVSVKDIVATSMYLTVHQDTITTEGLNNSSSNLIEEEKVLIATRISPGAICINKYPVAINQDLRGLYLNNKLIKNKFLVYFFKTLSIQGKGTTVKGISVEELEKIKIPLPPLEEQERIVNILDRFDALCNDLTCGLPAEIEARRKQYAYYRDKLLTFKNIAENSC